MKKIYYIILLLLATIINSSCNKSLEIERNNENYMMVGGTKNILIGGYINEGQIWLICEGLSFKENEEGKFRLNGTGFAFALLDDNNGSPVLIGTHEFGDINGGVFLNFNFDDGTGFGNPLSGNGYCTLMFDQTDEVYTIIANGLYWQNNMELAVSFKGKLTNLND